MDANGSGLEGKERRLHPRSKAHISIEIRTSEAAPPLRDVSTPIPCRPVNPSSEWPENSCGWFHLAMLWVQHAVVVLKLNNIPDNGKW